MKLKKMSALALSVLLLSSCVKDADYDPNGNEPFDEGTGNTTFVFSVNNSDAGLTKSVTSGDAEDSGEHDLGVAEEYAVKSVRVFLFDPTTKTFIKSLDLQNISNPSVDQTTKMVDYTSQKQEVDPGSYHVFAVANSNFSFTSGSLTDFLASVDKTTYSAGYITKVPAEGFVMTNRGADNMNIDVPQNKEVVVKIILERVVAKVDIGVKGQSNVFDLSHGGKKYASVTLGNYQMVNFPKTYNMYRHVADLPTFAAPASYDIPTNFGNISNNNGYAIDPLFFLKDPAKTGTFDYTHFVQPYVGFKVDKANWTAITSAALARQYCLENTLFQTSQINGYTTGVIFKATVTPTEVLTATGTTTSPNNTIYYAGYKFYNSIKDLVAIVGKISIGGTLINENTSDADLAKKNIRRIRKDASAAYSCYYNYWMKHHDNGNPAVMGVMEFGIVRNNHYILRVAKIADIGSGTVIPDPIEPDEKLSYLTVELAVKPWVVRDQGDVELK